MEVCTFSFDELNSVMLGRQGENGVRQIVIDLGDWPTVLDGPDVMIVALRPGEDSLYVPAGVTVSGSEVTWEIDSVDTALDGAGYAEIRLSKDGAIKKSHRFTTKVSRSLMGNGEPAQPQPPEWAAEIMQSVADATTAAEGAAADAAAAAAQAAEMADEVTDLKSAINVLEDGNLPIPIIKDSYIMQNGNVAAYPGWDRTDFIPCNPGEKFYVTNTTRTVYCFWYASKDVSTKVQQLIVEVGESIITAPAGAYYFIVSNTAAAMASMTIRGLALYSELMSAKSYIEASFDMLKETTPEKNTINRFDKTKITSGKFINIRNGTLASGNGFFASDFIYVGDLTSVTVSYTHLFCWYDQNKAWLDENETDMNSGTNDLTYDVPEGAKYLRFSAYNANLDYAQIGHGISRANYIQYGAFTLDGLILGGDDIIVDANGYGDYTSFTLACKENYGNAKNIVVKPGTYNIVDEYVAIWGQSAVDSMSDADSATFDGWQYGVKMNGRRFTFMPGAKLVCDWTGHTVDGTHRFSALRVEMNVEIIGLDLDGTHLFYVIHDDYGTNDAPYTVAYRNCRVFGHNLTNANCIGGGCKKYSRHIIENCYFDNGGLASSTTVRYHNTNADGAVPELYISNSYFNGWVTPRYYGTQTSKMRAYINNCKAQKIAVIAESGSYTTENCELYKWCNEEAE